MSTTDQNDILDAPELYGFFTVDTATKFYPYIQGGADDSASDSSEDGDGDASDKGDDKPKSQSSDDTDSDKSEGKTLTQDEVNRIVAREVGKASRGKIDPKELGFDSAKQMQEFVDSMKAKAEQDKTDAEKKVEEAVKAATDEATAGVLSKANDRIIRAEFLVKAKDKNVRWVDDAFAIAREMESWDVSVNDDGEVKGLTDEFFDELKEAKPFLFDTAESSDQGGRSGDAGHRAGGGGVSDSEKDLRTKYPALGQSVGRP